METEYEPNFTAWKEDWWAYLDYNEYFDLCAADAQFCKGESSRRTKRLPREGWSGGDTWEAGVERRMEFEQNPSPASRI